VKFILDTHILLWALSDPARIGDDRRHRIEDRSNTVYVSAISIAEIAIKTSLGKLRVEDDLLDVVNESGFELLSFTVTQAIFLKDLPFHHKDPFDRMLIAQATLLELPIMTDDGKFEPYECKLL